MGSPTSQAQTNSWAADQARAVAWEGNAHRAAGLRDLDRLRNQYGIASAMESPSLGTSAAGSAAFNPMDHVWTDKKLQGSLVQDYAPKMMLYAGGPGLHLLDFHLPDAQDPTKLLIASLGSLQSELPTMPKSFRKVVEIQVEAIRRESMGHSKRWDLRFKALKAATIDTVVTLAARVVRIAFNTIIVLPKAAWYKTFSGPQFFNIKGAATEVFTRYAEEWKDLKVTFLAAGFALCKIVNPRAYTNSIEKILSCYHKRQERKDQFDKEWSAAKAQFDAKMAAEKVAKMAKNAAKTAKN